MNRTPAPRAFRPQPLIDQLLEPWQALLGADLAAYRNHAHRLYHLTRALHQTPSPEAERQTAVAAAFHDLAIWEVRSLDYLEPSATLAVAWLEEQGLIDDIDMVRAMVLDHHRLRPVTPALVEAFRRADWCDVSQGRLRSGLAREYYAALKAQYPFLGFHSLLLRLGARQLRQDPLRPLPMLRW